MNFIEFLVEETKTPPKPKARPKKNLGFDNRDFWYNDIQMERNPFELVQAEDEEETILAVDKDQKKVYGFWKSKANKGMTFFNARPLHTVVSSRSKLKPYK